MATESVPGGVREGSLPAPPSAIHPELPDSAAPSAPARLWRALGSPVDGASLAALRALFGLLLSVAAVRFLAKGTVRFEYLEPHVFFPVNEWTWLRPLPGVGMYVVWGLLAVLGLTLSVGLCTRLSAALFCVLFSYTHLVDKTNYLNHYYLVTLLTALCVVLPVGQVGSVDAWRRPGPARPWVPAWALWLVRFQVGCVYLFGGIAKLQPDWLLRAMPLRIWLPAVGDMPLLGPLLMRTSTARAMSWAGAVYDLSVPFLLLWARTRPLAYLAVVFFHTVTGMLFNIGMFPLFMVASSLIFLPPAWPRSLLALVRPSGPRPPPALPDPPGRWVLAPWQRALLVGYALVQLLLPLRHWAYPGNVLWTEDGFRFSWMVMLIEKNGDVEFTVVDRQTGRREPVRTRDHLTAYQEKAMAAQPDLLLAFAHHLARFYRERGRDVGVYADAHVSLNGRPPSVFVDPSVDLSQVPESLGPRWWIRPLPR